MDEQEIDLRDVWQIIKKRWIIIVTIPLIAAITSGILSFFVLKPVYEASTTLIVGKKADSGAQTASQLLENSVIQANKQLALTYAEIAKSRTVEQNVINELGLDITAEELDEKVTVSPVKDTEVLAIAVTDNDAELAASIANSTAKNFSEAVIDIKKVDSVSIIDDAITPIDPIKPNKLQNIIIAFAVGLMAALGIAFLLEFLDNTVKTSKDVEEVLGIPVLGVIPYYNPDEA